MKSKIFYKKKVITRVNSPGVHVITDVKNLSKSVQDSIPGGDRFFWPKIYPSPRDESLTENQTFNQL